jgi:hypothetical protein
MVTLGKFPRFKHVLDGAFDENSSSRASFSWVVPPEALAAAQRAEALLKRRPYTPRQLYDAGYASGLIAYGEPLDTETCRSAWGLEVPSDFPLEVLTAVSLFF